MDLELLRERAAVIRNVRAFFDRLGYLETDTPLMAPDLIPESCLEVFEISRLLPGRAGQKRPYWLIPSPEIWMKRLIASHRVSMYQICKCFRNGESAGRFHSPEFTMLEYYTMNAGYRDSLDITRELFAALMEHCAEPGFSGDIETVTIAEAFSRWAGFDLYAAAEREGGLEAEARRLGLDPMPGLGTPEIYDLIFIHTVEPKLPKDRLVALTDYPAFTPCMARKNPEGKTVQRWELYGRGVELANCYSEETDPYEVRKFFETEAAEKERSALVRHAVDPGYWKNFLPLRGEPFPQCSGVAMGLDRLIMVLTGRKTIDGVLPFPMD
ncbi:MAG: LysR family transcriptional regulator [Treponema sp.]|jgi:lysyl-tRNA synthetase class 2|nr:LysR family transcriptional regulator [Treponema sp.]